MLSEQQASTVVTGAEVDLRASDRERERAVELLRVASGEGRLTLEELEDRTGRALGARTRAELDRLTHDLPSPGSPTRAARRLDEPSPRPHRSRREQLAVYAAVNVLLIVIWAVTGAGYFWPIWPLLGWGIGIAKHSGRGSRHRARAFEPSTGPRISA